MLNLVLTHIIIQTNIIVPGPGHITKELLNRGAKNIVAVERNSFFMTELRQLASESNGRLRTFHGDYFMLSDGSRAPIKHPWVSVSDLFHGVHPQPWKAVHPSKSNCQMPGLILYLYYNPINN